jgi:hypothetical protein
MKRMNLRFFKERRAQMSEEHSKRTQNEDLTRVDRLLGLLGELSQQDPSSALRDRLSSLAAERLNQNAAPATHDSTRPFLVWLRPVFAAVLLVAIGLTIALGLHFRRQEPTQAHRTTTGATTGAHPAHSPTHIAQVAPAPRPSVSRHKKAYHAEPAVPPSLGETEPSGEQQMTLRLPYSNSAIETGTGATIRVSMSQSELLSLGFPLNTTVRDRRVVAELTLGDDGLPRAISVPLPLEVVKEKK